MYKILQVKSVDQNSKPYKAGFRPYDWIGVPRCNDGTGSQRNFQLCTVKSGKEKLGEHGLLFAPIRTSSNGKLIFRKFSFMGLYSQPEFERMKIFENSILQ